MRTRFEVRLDREPAETYTARLRAFLRDFYGIDEAAGETVEVCLGPDGVAHAEVVKYVDPPPGHICVPVDFKKEPR